MYILRCSNGQYYVGSTKELAQRMEQHQQGEGSKFTKKHLPVELVYYEEYQRIDEAFIREHQIKGWNRKKKEALINQQYELLPKLSESKKDH
jgi:putative endonuclease